MSFFLSEIKNFLTNQGFSKEMDAAVILGSGLGGFVDRIENPISVPYEKIPGFPETSVHGHAGDLCTGTIGNKKIIVFSGRFHLYEGHEQSVTVLPVRIANEFSARKLIISNAAGAINESFKVGDLMVIEDIFRLFEMVSSRPGDKFRYHHYETARKLRQIAAELQLEVQRGTYLFVNGPNYETKAEIRAFRILGADVVGMSTVPELIEASRLKLQTAAVSLITNMAAGVTKKRLDHSEVKKAAESRKDDFAKYVSEIILKL
ncbi:MAG: purine-nucleoside phosphorylase [Balneolaceae bacterium]